MTNTSPENTLLTDLWDDQIGGLDGVGNCVIEGTILPSDTYRCSYTVFISGNAGGIYLNGVLPELMDDEANIASIAASASVIFTNVPPGITVTVTPDVSSIPEPGGDVTYTVEVENISPENQPITLTDLVDDVFGDLNTQGDCVTPTVIAQGVTYSCSFTGTVAGLDGDSTFNTVTATVEDDEGTPVSDDGSATVDIDPPTAVNVSGQVRDDTDYDGDFGDSDSGISDVSLELYDGACVVGSTCPTTTTKGTGNYTFSNVLPPGSYTIFETDPAGFSSTADTQGANDNQIDITLAYDTDSTGNDFLDASSPPAADAGGPYAIAEGDSVNLDASASSGPTSDPLTYAWDLNNDSVYGDVTGETPTVSWATLVSFGLDDDASYPISVEVDDGNGFTDTTATTIVISNTPPTLSTTGAATTGVGQVYTLNLSAVDPGDDTITSWTINWGDGTIDTIVGNPASVTHTYNNLGFTNNILASAIDEDGTHLQNELVVASSGNDKLNWYDNTGAARTPAQSGPDAGLDYSLDPIIGPDGNLYVSGWNSDNVVRYNATTGAYIDEFVTAGSGGLNGTLGMAFGPDGRLYVASEATSEVLRYNGTTGAFIDAFVTAGLGGLDNPEGLTFGPDGNLYVGDYQKHTVLRYDGSTGAFIDIFVTAQLGGLENPEDLVFGSDGNLYVASDKDNNVVRYNGTTGAFIDEFVAAGNGLQFALGVGFGPDGNLYVGSWGDDTVKRYNGTTGAYIDNYVTGGLGGLLETAYFDFIPEQQVLVVP